MRRFVSSRFTSRRVSLRFASCRSLLFVTDLLRFVVSDVFDVIVCVALSVHALALAARAGLCFARVDVRPVFSTPKDAS